MEKRTHVMNIYHLFDLKSFTDSYISLSCKAINISQTVVKFIVPKQFYEIPLNNYLKINLIP